jgi:hypothetical protein
METQPQSVDEDMFDAVPLRLIPTYSSRHRFAPEGEGKRQGKKSVNERHSYRFVPIFRVPPMAALADQGYLTQIKATAFLPG